MQCEQINVLFSPYVDKMTNQKENEIIEAHLQNCSACKQQLDELKTMCALLKTLDVPPVPDRFAVDLKKRLAHEKVKMFASREVTAPKKSGWLVAGVAGIALTLGIFASSIMPIAPMVASLENWINGDTDKPSVAVVDNNDILKQWAEKQGTSKIAANLAVNSPTKNGSASTPIEPDKITPENHAVTAANTETVAMKERIVENYSEKIKVDDADETMQQLQQLANANGGQYTLKPNNSISAASASSVTVIALQVPKENVDSVLNSLASLGAGVPAKGTSDYTQAYAETEKALNNIDKQMAELNAQQNLTSEQQQQLNKLKEQQNDLLSEKQRIDKEYNFVTIEVRLVEAINP